MVVCKFGGAVLATPEGFPTMASIVAAHTGEPVVLVVSALGSTTRLLDRAIEQARTGDSEGARGTVDELVDLHNACIDGLDLGGDHDVRLRALLEERRMGLQALLRGVSTTRQCTARVRDRVLSWGEDIAREITVQWLRFSGVPCVGVPARSVIVTTDSYGSAQPIADATSRHALAIIAPLLEQHGVVVIEGFVGQTTAGDVTTMGRESSNLTATLVGSVLHARMVTIFTDVEGVRSADPHQLNGTSLRPHLSYAQARVAAKAGVKLLYPTMMEPAERAGIPIRIASAINLHGASTIIDAQPQEIAPIVVSVELDNNRHRCTTLYVDPVTWLHALTSILQSIHDLPSCDVMTDAAAQRADVIVPSAFAPVFLEQLHTSLCHEAHST